MDPSSKSDRKPILEASVLAPERPFANIDDVRHDFRLMQEFGAIEHAEFTRDSRRYDELFNKEKRSKAEDREMEVLLDRLFDRVLVNSKALREQLADGERDLLTGVLKREFVLTFTNAPQLMRLMALQQKKAEMEAGSSSITAS